MSTLDQLVDDAVLDYFTPNDVPRGTALERQIESESEIVARAQQFSKDDIKNYREFAKRQGGSLKGKEDHEVRYIMAEREMYPQGRAGYANTEDAAEEVRDTRIYGGNPRGGPEHIVYGLSRATEAVGINDLARGLRQGGIMTPARGVAGTSATLHRVFGSEEEAAIYDRVAQDLMTRHDGGRGIAGLTGNVIGSAVPTVAGLLAGGASLPMLFYGVTAYGNAGQDYREAMDQRGLDPKLQDEIVHGAGAAMIEIVTERIGLDLLGRIGKRGVVSIGDSIMQGQVKQAAFQIAVAGGEGAAVNAIEEVLAQVMNNARERYGVPGLAGEVNPDRKLTEGTGEAALGGAIVGGLLGGGVRVSQGGGSANAPVNDEQSSGLNADDSDASPASVVENAGADSGNDPVSTPSVATNTGATRESLGDDVARFFRANGTEGQIVEPETDQQREIQQRAAERGLNVQFVRGKDRLGRPAANPSPGVILLDADASPGRQTDALLWHEMVHEVERQSPEAWADLNAALSEIVPELMDQAQSRYQAGWKNATGEDVSPDILMREGPSVAAELVIDAIVNEDASPGSLSRALSERPGIKDRIISVFQSIMNRLGLRRGLTLLEQAKGTQDATRAALLIRDAVRALKPYAPGTATSAQSGAVQAAPETQVQDSVDEPAVTWPRKRRPGEYSKRDIRRRLRDIADQYDFLPGEGLELSESERAEIADDTADFGFGSDRLPGELTEALKDQPPAVRRLFETNKQGAHGEETLLTLGADEMIRRARTVALTGDQGVGEFVRSNLGGEPIADVLMLLDDLYGNQLREAQGQIEVQENPEQLPDGATFEIAGDEFVVYTDEQRGKRFTNGSRDLSLQVPEIPMDANTLNRNAGASREDVEVDLPFAVSPPEGSRAFRKWFGDSKVVDENGDPLVVYHGTGDARLTSLDRAMFGQGNDQYGPGFYMTSKANEASGYTTRRIDPDTPKLGGEDAPGVLPLYVSLQNPLEVNADDIRHLDDAITLSPRQAFKVMQKSPVALDPDGPLADWIPGDGESRYTLADLRSVANNYESPMMIFGDIYREQDAAAFIDALSDVTGYDGVVVTFPENKYDAERKHVVAWKPSQIKSVNNSGTFDPTNPDIRFAVQGGGQQDLPNAQAAETFVPQGRPDLANPGDRPDARQFVNTVDELRNIAGEPVRMSDDEVERRADRMLATNESTIEQALKDKVDRGGLLDDVETVVAQRLVNRRVLDAVAQSDRKAYRAALELTETYRQSGTLAARAFRQRRDQLKGPAERYRESLMRAFLEPDMAVRERMKRIREQLQDDTVSDRRKRKLRDEQGRLFDRETRKVAKVKQDLEKQGYDTRLLTEEAMQDPRTAASVIDIARRARTKLSDGLYWVWMNSILSGPQTHVANIIGNAANFGWRFGGLKGVEAVAGSLQKRFGGDPDFTTSDYLHMWRMMGPAIADGYSNMVRSFATNRQIFDEQITGERDQGYRFKGEAVRVPDSGPRNRALRAAGLGGLPLKLLTAEDQFFKTVAGTLEAHALAHRQAVREGLEGDARSERITELLQPRRGMFNEEYYDTDIWNQAYEDALTAVFQDDPSRIGKAAMELREGSLGFLLKWFIPFVRTPDRLFVRGIETSPLGAVKGLTASGKVIEGFTGTDYLAASESSPAQDIAVALGAVGILAAMWGWKDDEDGFPRITGSREQDYSLSGEQYRTAPPYSIRIGDNWYSYARIEPLSTGMALTVDLLDKLEDGDTLSDAALGSLDTLIGLTQDKTFVRSIGQLVEVFASPFTGSEGAGENAIELLSDTFITGWVPNLAKQTIRAAEPEIVDNRAPGDAPFWEKQAAELPYKALPISDLAPVPRYDIWGRPIERGDPFGNEAAGFLWRLAVPIKVSPNDLHPMDLLIYNYNEKVRRNEVDNALDVDGADSSGEIHAKPPSRYFTRGGERIDLTADEYQSMIKNAGERASERLLSMNLNVEDPSPRDAQRIKDVLSREYQRERSRIYRERRSSENP